ncbi:hypothetical protein DPMN_061323 [Dreissena polymorpha]|uniref:Uncharacterized protein n=1 Tax=Dreissena polymorpha TaxID=45954 RepID=A0A9D4HIC6_DREPO|nr:hypothetical protein DPMN_061323 [Dreissena polymorpha]
MSNRTLRLRAGISRRQRWSWHSLGRPLKENGKNRARLREHLIVREPDAVISSRAWKWRSHRQNGLTKETRWRWT